MATIKAPTATAQKRAFIGKAWKHEKDGAEYLSVSLNRDLGEVALKSNDRMLLWPNKKREGKQDADYNLSISLED